MKTIVLDISILNEKNKTGVGIYTYELIKNLLKINKKDKFILFGISTLQTFEYLKNIEFKKYPNVEIKIYKMPSRFFRRAFLLWQKLNWPSLEKLVGDFDIFHSFNWNLPPIGKGKMVATVFDMTPLLFPKFHLKKTIQLDKVRLERIKKYADLVITISENSRKDFLNFFAKRKVEVIYPAGSKTSLRKLVYKKYHLKPGFMLFVGTLEPRKNLERIIKAFAKMESRVKNQESSHLVIVGSKGWLSKDIYKLPKKLGIEDKVKFLGRIEEEDLFDLYNQALCLVYPSLYEGFGLPILEAQACGCPVITSNLSSMPEVAGKGAILVDPYSVEEITNAMIGVRESESQRVKLIKKGFENLKRFSWEDSAKKLNDLYQLL